jgi:hypothetical protein
MNINFQNKFSEKFISKVLQITAALTVLFYIVFSFTKHFTINEKFYWLPFFLFSINFLILIEIIYLVKVKKMPCEKNEFRKLVGQTFLNLCFVVFILTYLI